MRWIDSVKSSQDFGAWRSGRVKHDRDNTDIVCTQAAHVPALDGEVDQLFGRIDPGVTAIWVDHVTLVVAFSVEHRLDGHSWRKNVPETIGGEDETLVFQGTQVDDVQVGIGTNHKDIIFGVVAPEISESTRNRQERNFFDVSWAADRALVSVSWSVPEVIKIKLPSLIKTFNWQVIVADWKTGKLQLKDDANFILAFQIFFFNTITS